MTHPGARPGRAGGGWAEAWSGQRERGEGPGRTAAWWGLCLLIRLATLTGDWAPAGPAPRRWVRRPGCKSVQEGPLPQVSSHLSSNFRPKVRPQPSCPLLLGPACRRQRRLWPPLPGPPSQPGLRGSAWRRAAAASPVPAPGRQDHSSRIAVTPPAVPVHSLVYKNHLCTGSCLGRHGWTPRGPGSHGTDRGPQDRAGSQALPVTHAVASAPASSTAVPAL